MMTDVRNIYQMKERLRILWVIAFVTVSLILFWKCRYGYTYLDEGFYPTIAARFLQGDRILVDEWNNTQLSNFVILPLMWVYKSVRGDYTGVYLFIRYVYTVLKILISIYVFRVIKNYDVLAAYMVAISYLAFAAYGMMVLSYNSIASGGVIMALLTLMDRDIEGKRKCIMPVVSGIFLSMAVLANPYLAILYLLYFLIVVIGGVRRKTEYPCDIRTFLKVTMGVCISLSVFFSYVASHSSIAAIMDTLPHILYGDPAHVPKSFYYKTAGYLARILVGNDKNYLSFVIYVLMTIVTVRFLLCRNKRNYRSGYIEAQITLNIALLVEYLIVDNYINHIFFVPNVLAIEMLIAIRDDISLDMLKFLWIPGMAYTYLEYLSSNTGLSGIGAASCVASVGSISIIVHTLRMEGKIYGDKDKKVKVCRILGTVFVLGLFISTLTLRITYVFWEQGLGVLTNTISDGPCKGLLVADEQYEYYNNLREDTAEIRDMDDQINVLFVSDKALWLAGNQRCASYSPLCYSITTTDLIFDYYKAHPEKIADVVYIDATYGEDFMELLSERLYMDVERKEFGWLLRRSR